MHVCKARGLSGTLWKLLELLRDGDLRYYMVKGGGPSLTSQCASNQSPLPVHLATYVAT